MTIQKNADLVESTNAINRSLTVIQSSERFGVKFRASSMAELKNVGWFGPSAARKACT